MASADQVSLQMSPSDEPAVNADAESTQIAPDLNDECLLEILQLLPVTERLKMERVCHRWKVLIPKSFANIKCLELPHKCYLWYTRYGGQSAILGSLVNRVGSPHITSADFLYLYEPFDRTDLVLLASKCPNLTKVACSVSTFSSVAEGNIGAFLGQIESLKVDYTGIGARHEWSPQPVDDFERNLGVGLSAMANLTHLDVLCGDRLGTFNCPQLISLRVSGSRYSYPTARAFAKAIRSLAHLKELDVRGNRNFNDRALRNVCRYLPQLESLKIDDRPKDHLSHDELPHIGGLKNLKVLEIVRRCSHPVDDEFVAKLCAGNGATLEQLRFRSKLVTDASFERLGIECGSLAKLDVHECPKFTLAGLNSFVDAISNDPSWTDPTKNRRLQITVGLGPTFQNGVDTINEVVHPGRLVVTNIDPVSIDADWANWDDHWGNCGYTWASDEDD